MSLLTRFRRWLAHRREFNQQRWLRRNGVVYTWDTKRRRRVH